MRRLTLLVVGILAGCAGAPTPVERPPLVEVEPPPPDETPQIREVLSGFLHARWSFDHETANALVTDEDASNPWQNPLEEQIVKMRNADTWLEHTWTIGPIEVDHDVAVASVELVGPGIHDLMFFQMRSSLRIIKATSRWLRDRKKQQAEVETVSPPRQVRTLTYQLHKVDEGWRVYMDWAGVRAMAEEHNPEIRQEMYEGFRGSERELHAPEPQPDARTRDLIDAINRAERAVNERDFERARRLYEVVLVSDTAVPEFLGERLATFDDLEKQQQDKLARANVEVGPLRDVGGAYEVRVKNGAEDLRSFRLIAEYVDDEGEQSYRSIYEQKLLAGESRTVLVHPRRGKPATRVRLVDVHFLDRDVQQEFRTTPDKEFHRRLQDLKTGGAARSNAARVAMVVDDEAARFDACPWADDDEFVDLWIEVQTPPTADVARALSDDEELGACLADIAASLEYPDAANNRSVIRVYPPSHWWRL